MAGLPYQSESSQLSNFPIRVEHYLGTIYIQVQVCQTSGNGESHPDHGLGAEGVRGEVVKQGPVFMVVSHQPS